jgi:cytosine deaminase
VTTDAFLAATVADDPACVRLMQEFIRTHPVLWNEDIGL